jgi:geranylgeranyl pyrophosphate synthase
MPHRPSAGLARRRLEADRELIEKKLEDLLSQSSSGFSPFREAMRYAVLGQGQRIRPLLAVRMGRLVGAEETVALRAACAIELLHCASLIVDDLPSMDNDAMRRGKPSVHVVFGEATALLAAFGLVALAARCPVEVACTPAATSGVIRFQIELLKVLDASGLCEGQDLDLRVEGAERERMRARVNELKTVPLFELCAHAAAIFSDPDSFEARALRRFAREFGMAFQAVDDLLDGETADRAGAEQSLANARRCLQPLEPAAGELHELIDYLHERSQQ